MGYKHKKDSNKNMFSDSYNEEELLENGEMIYDDDEDISDDSEDELDEESEDQEEKGLNLSFACEDCDYRWDDYIVGEKDEIESEEFDIVCPMCGSINVSQI